MSFKTTPRLVLFLAVALAATTIKPSSASGSYPSSLNACGGQPFSSLDDEFASRGIDVDKSSCNNGKRKSVSCDASCASGYSASNGVGQISVRCLPNRGGGGGRVWRIQRSDSIECEVDSTQAETCGPARLSDYADSLNLVLSGCSRRSSKNAIKCDDIQCVDGAEFNVEPINGRVNGKRPKFHCKRIWNGELAWRLWPRVQCIAPITEAPTTEAPTTEAPTTEGFSYAPLTLDCSLQSSRDAVSAANPDAIDGVESCCCSELDPIQEVRGDINIAGTTTEATFTNLVEVEGNVYGYSGQLASLDLGVLTSIGGNFYVYSNLLTSLNLGSLNSVAAAMDFGDNSLASVDISGLTVIGGLFGYNNPLTSLTFSPSLTRIGGSPDYPNFDFSDCQFTSLDFANIEQVDGYIDFAYNAGLTSVNFGSMTFVGGGVYGPECALTSVDLSSFTSMPGDVDFDTNPLNSIDFGTSLTSIGGYLDLGNCQLPSIDFGSITAVSAGVYLSQNLLTSLDLTGLSTVGADLSAWDNQITSINFGSLTEVNGFLSLSGNNLNEIDLAGIAQVATELYIFGNQLTSVNFGALTSVGTDLDLSANSLTEIDFGSLQSIGGYLSLHTNDLTQLDLSTSSLTSIGGFITVSGNPNLSLLDCNNLGSCIYTDQASLTIQNCPAACP